MLKSAIKVYARIKPTNDRNEKVHSYYIQRESTINRKESLIINPNLNSKTSHVYSFKFTRVFPADVTQHEFYETVGRPVVNRLLSGYNGAIFAFGQTGTGKTHTIIGDLKSHRSKGVISRVFEDVFCFVKNNSRYEYSMFISSMEIYNEVCYDLTSADREKAENGDISFNRVTLMEETSGNVEVINLQKHKVRNVEEVMKYLTISLDNRVVADTPMNSLSSRSHFIFTLYLGQENRKDDIYLNSKLHMIDLAGSERISKKNIPRYLFDEAKNINLALHYLEQVIVALNEPSRFHVPYRNSLLTSLLRDSLGGNCCTAMIFTVSLQNDNLEESITTCRFAQRVSLVKNEPTITFERVNNNEIPFISSNKRNCNNLKPKRDKKKVKQPNQSNSNESGKCEHSDTKCLPKEECSCVTVDSEYIKYTVNHINRGIKLLSVLLKEVPSLITNNLVSKQKFTQNFTSTLGLELPEKNPFTGKHYSTEQKLAFKEFISTTNTHQAVIKYLEMNLTYYKYLENEWRLWNKEMLIMEKIREVELQMRTAIKLGDFPDTIEKISNSFDGYVKKYNRNKNQWKIIQENKQKGLILFTDARNKLIRTFEKWWRRLKQNKRSQDALPETSFDSSSKRDCETSKDSNDDSIRRVFEYGSTSQTVNTSNDRYIANSPMSSETIPIPYTVNTKNNSSSDYSNYQKKCPSSLQSQDLRIYSCDEVKNCEKSSKKNSNEPFEGFLSKYQTSPLLTSDYGRRNGEELGIAHQNKPMDSTTNRTTPSYNTVGPMFHVMNQRCQQRNVSVSSPGTVRLSSTGDEDLDSRILSFYKNQQVSVVY